MRRPIPSIEGRPDDHPWRRPRPQSPRRCTTTTTWPELSGALTSAQHGDGAGLLSAVRRLLRYNGDGTWGNELEAFQTISCMDTDRAALGRRGRCHGADVHRGGTPLLPAHDRQLLLHVLPCVDRSTHRDHRCRRRPDRASAAPTGDASTPLEGTRAMADALEDSRSSSSTPSIHLLGSIGVCRPTDHRLSRRPRSPSRGDGLPSQLAEAADAQLSSRRWTVTVSPRSRPSARRTASLTGTR